MEPTKDQEPQDFTAKGRTSHPENESEREQGADISNIDRQEGEQNNGTVAKDEHLFKSEEEPGAAS